MRTGSVTRVDALELETHLSATEAIGSTVLSVDNAAVFSEGGGILNLDGVQVVYVSADEDADTVTLAVATVAEYEVGFPLQVVGANGTVSVEYVAQVQPDDPDADVIMAPVDSALIPQMPAGDYPATPVEMDDDGALVRILGQDPDLTAAATFQVVEVTTSTFTPPETQSLAVTYPTPFPPGVVPIAVATVQDVGVPERVAVSVSDRTQFGCTVNIYRSTGVAAVVVGLIIMRVG